MHHVHHHTPSSLCTGAIQVAVGDQPIFPPGLFLGHRQFIAGDERSSVVGRLSGSVAHGGCLLTHSQQPGRFLMHTTHARPHHPPCLEPFGVFSHSRAQVLTGSASASTLTFGYIQLIKVRRARTASHFTLRFTASLVLSRSRLTSLGFHSKYRSGCCRWYPVSSFSAFRARRTFRCPAWRQSRRWDGRCSSVRDRLLNVRSIQLRNLGSIIPDAAARS